MAQDSGGGGGGGGTPWNSISIHSMWAWVNRDLSPHYQQANSWKKASELTGLYHLRLQTFRDRLAQSWNPDNSPAAQTYLTKLDELIAAVRNVDEVAGRNYQASVDIPNAISEAKFRLKPIYERYQRAEQEYNSSGGHPTSSPSGERSPADRMNDDHAAAVGIMAQLGSDLSTARTSLGPPRPYVAPVPKRDSGGDYGGGGGGGGGMPPPMIPPVVPSAPPPSSPPPMSPTTPIPIPKGPDLVQLIPTPTLPTPPTMPTVPTPPTVPTVPPPGSPVPPVIKPPTTGPLPPTPGRPTVPGVPQRPNGPIITGPLGGTPGGKTPTTGIIGGQPPGRTPGPSGVRTNPVGGMIGGPAAGPNRPGPTGASVVNRPGTPPVPPAGGVTRGPAGTPGAAGVVGGANRPGATGSTPARGTGTGTGGRGLAGAMGVAGRGGKHDEDGEHFDPDTQWEVVEGVTPVLDAPDTQGPIDPGPAIGLTR